MGVANVASAQMNGTSSGVKAHPARHKAGKTPSTSSLQLEMRQMREELQAEIDALKQQLAERDAQLDATRVTAEAAQKHADTVATENQTLSTMLESNSNAVSALRSTVAEAKQSNEVNSAALQQMQKTNEDVRKAIEEPVALHYKGITLVPGGFLALESIWRQRAMNADIYTNFNATPYMNSGKAHMSEWVPSARQSRLSFLASGKVPFGKISGFFEGDFLSAGVTSNNLQSNSYTMRVRQAWGQVAAGRTTITGGQMWTLLTENKKGASPGQEAFPLFFDANLHVGYTYVRQPAFRLQEAFTPAFTLAVSLENSQYQFSASNAPKNFFFGAPGAGGGLNNPSANYTNQVAPDVLVKASFDPGYGHYEIGGIARFFRDRYYPDSTTSTGARNDTKLGGGFVANARFPVTKKADVGLHLVAGDGTGRYGASLLPDITVRPNGTLEPLRNAQGLLSLEGHPTPKLDLFGYLGTEYVQRTYYRDNSGTLVGYAPPSASNAGCNVEAIPTSGSGYAPGVNTCLGATRVITQGSVGWLYRLYSGPKGRIQYGLAYSYLTRDGWAGVGGAPKATNNFVYTSFRYYMP
jgi:hypothetical protein